MFGFRVKTFGEHTREIHLPLAPMADVFIVLLIFLLKTFSFEYSAIPANPEIQLPSARGKETEAAEVRIDISRDRVSIQDRAIASLSEFQFSKRDIDAAGEFIPLKTKLGVAHPAHITLYADQATPYSTVKTVLQTAMSTGLSKLQIAVSQDGVSRTPRPVGNAAENAEKAPENVTEE